MDTNRTPRSLTHDEQKAAEAAFGGRPFNPRWSESAKKVYEGLVRALPQVLEEQGGFADRQDGEESVKTPPSSPVVTGSSKAASSSESEEAPTALPDEPAQKLLTNRQDAIQAGFLIDVTAEAKKLGLTFPVAITKSLWEVGIAPNQALSDEDTSDRLRDVLMAFRLRLASQATLSPLIDFPALLPLPSGAVPQPVPLFALIQPDEQNRAMATLLLPNEVSATIIPMN